MGPTETELNRPTHFAFTPRRWSRKLKGWLDRRHQEEHMDSLTDVAVEDDSEVNSLRRVLGNLLAATGVRYHVAPESSARVPATGAVVLMVNRSLHGLETLALTHLVAAVRDDMKVLSPGLPGGIGDLDPLAGALPAGDDHATRPFDVERDGRSWLANGGLLLWSPRGRLTGRGVGPGTDGDAWTQALVRVVREGQATVVPVHVDAGCGHVQLGGGLLHPKLRGLLLRPRHGQGNEPLTFRLGTPIPPRILARCGSDRELRELLLVRTLILGKRDRPGRGFRPWRHRTPGAEWGEAIIPAVEVERLREDIGALADEQRLATSRDLTVYVAHARQIPHVLREIGRLREITFRESQEGTGKAIDLDRFDEYYEHLFIWNEVKGEVVAAYRLGRTDEILAQHGMRGLYTGTLFAYKRRLLHQLGPALEMGRSFVRPEYQRSFAPLLLLWRGIGEYVVGHPRYCRLFGPVSINNEYQSFSQQLIVSFLRLNSFAGDLAKAVKPRHPFRGSRLRKAELALTSRVTRDIDEVSALVAEIESDQKGVPVLLRQYLKLGGKLLGFNRDPEFSNVLDGLILVDLRQTDPKLLTRYCGREGAASFLAYHEISVTE